MKHRKLERILETYLRSEGITLGPRVYWDSVEENPVVEDLRGLFNFHKSMGDIPPNGE